MEIVPITYRRRLVAACTRTHVWFTEEIESLPVRDPVQVFVAAMYMYAYAVLNDQLPGPYRDVDARVFARSLLIPRELLERSELKVELTAAGLGVPVNELRLAMRSAQCDAQTRRRRL